MVVVVVVAVECFYRSFSKKYEDYRAFAAGNKNTFKRAACAFTDLIRKICVIVFLR